MFLLNKKGNRKRYLLNKLLSIVFKIDFQATPLRRRVSSTTRSPVSGSEPSSSRQATTE